MWTSYRDVGRAKGPGSPARSSHSRHASIRVAGHFALSPHAPRPRSRTRPTCPRALWPTGPLLPTWPTGPRTLPRTPTAPRVSPPAGPKGHVHQGEVRPDRGEEDVDAGGGAVQGGAGCVIAYPTWCLWTGSLSASSYGERKDVDTSEGAVQGGARQHAKPLLDVFRLATREV